MSSSLATPHARAVAAPATARRLRRRPPPCRRRRHPDAPDRATGGTEFAWIWQPPAAPYTPREENAHASDRRPPPPPRVRRRDRRDRRARQGRGRGAGRPGPAVAA